MENEKKRLMYIQSEDFYFLTYNTIIFLKTLDCINGSRHLKDYRKISFLMDFISNPYYVSYLDKEILSSSDLRELTRLYSNGILRLKELNKLYYTLDSRKIITLSKKENSDVFDISLNIENVADEFLDEELFEIEIENSKVIKSRIKRLSSISLDSLKEKLFIDKGVKAWQLF